MNPGEVSNDHGDGRHAAAVTCEWSDAMRRPITATILALGMALTPFVGVHAATQTAQAPAYAGPQKSISIEVVGAPDGSGGATTNDSLTEMFTEALTRDGRFIVVERGLPATTVAAPGAEPGQMLGANILLRATVTKFEANAKGGGMQLSGLPSFGGIAPTAGLSGQTAVIEIALRLIDTSTGAVLTTAKAEGHASSRKADVGVTSVRTGATMDFNAFKATPMGKAAETAIAAAVDKIAAGMANAPWSAQVIEADGGQAYVNIGQGQNLGPGAILHVYRKSKTLTDPTTGAVLEVLMDEVGQLQIDQVREKVSTAKVLQGSAARGDIVKLQ